MSPSEDFRKPDIVLEHAVERLVEHAFAVDLVLIELQSLEPGIDHARAGAETGGATADVDPVGAHHRKHQQLALMEIGHVDDDVVEVLAGDRLVVGDDDVARLEALGAVALHAVDDDDAEVGDEVRDAADILRDQLALGVEQRGAIVAHLVDHHVVGGALQVGRHLVGDGGQRVADDLQRHRIERDALCRFGGLARRRFLSRLRHHAFPSLMINSPDGATLHSSLRNSTVVVPCSWINAGPTMRAPALSAVRW